MTPLFFVLLPRRHGEHRETRSKAILCDLYDFVFKFFHIAKYFTLIKTVNIFFLLCVSMYPVFAWFDSVSLCSLVPSVPPWFSFHTKAMD